MNRWLWLVLILILIAGTAGAYNWLSTSVSVRTARVERGLIREYIDERGTTRLPETHLITMPFEGRVEEVESREGEPVSAGQVVARVSRPDLQEEVAAARAAVDRLQASIEENADVSVEQSLREQAQLFVESMVPTVAAAEAQKLAGKSRLDYSEKSLGRTRQLAETGAQTQDDLELAELAYVEDQVGYREDVLVAEALKALQAATNLLPRMANEYIARKRLTGDVLRQEKEEAEARLRQALLRQKRGQMHSPVDGVVLERVIRDEQYLPAGTTLLRIGELDRLEVEADILSEDVVRIRQGDPVEVYGPAIGSTVGAGVPGVVERIDPAGFTKISSLGVEQQRVNVIVRFDDGVLSSLREKHNLGVGYRVRVRIFTAEQSGALFIPRSALFRGPDDERVFVVRSHHLRGVPVETGLRNNDLVQITSGLSEGDEVVLAPDATLAEGTRVHAD